MELTIDGNTKMTIWVHRVKDLAGIEIKEVELGERRHPTREFTIGNLTITLFGGDDEEA